MRLCVSPRKSGTPYPIVILNGRICLPRNLIPETQHGLRTDFNVEKFVKEFHERRRFLSALNVMEGQDDAISSPEAIEVQHESPMKSTQASVPSSERVEVLQKTPQCQCYLCDTCLSDLIKSMDRERENNSCQTPSLCGQLSETPSSSMSHSCDQMRQLTPDEISSYFETV